MLEKEFNDCIKQIEGYYRNQFNDYERDYLNRKALLELLPTAREMAKAVDIIFDTHERFMPKGREVCKAILLAKREIGNDGIIITQCGTCDGNGFVYTMNKNYEYPYRCAVPCTCTNAPAWMQNAKTHRDIIRDNPDLSIADFFDVHGRYLHEIDDAARSRRIDEVNQINERDQDKPESKRVVPSNWIGRFTDNRKSSYRTKPTAIGDTLDAPF